MVFGSPGIDYYTKIRTPLSFGNYTTFAPKPLQKLSLSLLKCLIIIDAPWGRPAENDNIVRVYISRLFNIFNFGQKYFSGKDTYYDLKYTRPPRSEIHLSKSDPLEPSKNHTILLRTNIKKYGADLGFLVYLVT